MRAGPPGRQRKRRAHGRGRCQAAPVNHDHISALAHAAHPVKAPLDDDSVTRLLRHAVPHGDARALDLGCGGGEWLLRALDGHPGLRAEGVDISEGSLRLAGEAADRLGVRGRLVLHQQDGAAFTSQDPFDLVLSVGAAHVFGGLLPTLAAAREHLAPGGRVLIGDGSGNANRHRRPSRCSGTSPTWRPPWTWSPPTAGHPSTATSARGANWTPTSGPAGDPSPPGHWTTPPTRTARRCSKRRRPAAPSGCAATGRHGAS
ncbi:class I SAM-dependent methyltransferase [Streptomyces sp. NPDC050392]|uniref:SAM-dependent methyltransferase n=1 Tax=Streptomyces sp. NPDC050392 TaxID=3155782 RepID=UPI0034268941